ncbi:MAG: tetratricopeptide repeat protein [bacterium]|nr:tetratricopeptide repeat protein [bacterium]
MWFRKIFAKFLNPSGSPAFNRSLSKVPVRPIAPEVLQRITDHVLQGDLEVGRTITYPEISPALVPLTTTNAAFRETVERWTKLLVLIRARPPACAVLLAQALVTEGNPEKAVRGVLNRLSPEAALRMPRSDPEYVEIELQCLDQSTYESLLAVAYAVLRHDQEFAVKLAKEGLRTQPNRHEADLCLGLIYSTGQQHAKAADHYESASRKGCTDCRLQWAKESNLAGRPQKVLQIVRDSPKLTPDLKLEEARATRRIGGTRAALPLYQRLPLSGLTDGTRARCELGGCLFEAGHYSEVILVAQQLASEHNPDALRIVGLSCFAQEDWGRCAHYLGRFVAAQTSDADVYAALAESRLRIGDLQGSYQAAQAALQIDGANRRAVRAACMALIRLRRWDDALFHIEQFGSDGTPLPYLMSLMTESGRLEEASQLVANWVERRPNDFEAWRWAGYLAERHNRISDAVQFYRSALRLRSDDRVLRRKIANLEQFVQDGSGVRLTEDRIGL